MFVEANEFLQILEDLEQAPQSLHTLPYASGKIVTDGHKLKAAIRSTSLSDVPPPLLFPPPLLNTISEIWILDKGAEEICDEYRGSGRIESDYTPPASRQICMADLLVYGIGFFADQEQADVSGLGAEPQLAELEGDGFELRVCY
jgi:hypothetical protein